MPKTAKKSRKAAEPVEEVVEEEVVEEVANEATDEAPRKQRRGVLSTEELLAEFDELVSYVETECQYIKDSGNTKGTKFLRSVNKRVKLLKNRTNRTLRSKRRGTRRSTNTVSGFMKPVEVSKEMSKFAGWDNKELRSRIDVTRTLCSYIKDHDLQNSEDRRQIIPDTKLRKLLRLGKGEDKLTYYQLQQKIQCHFNTGS